MMSAFFSSFVGRLRVLASSIRFRLTLWFVAILALVLLIFSVFIYTLQSRALTNETVERLGLKIRQIQTLNQSEGLEPFEGGITIPNISQDAGPILGSEDVLAITDNQGQVLQSYGPITEGGVNQLAAAGIQHGTSRIPFTYTLLSQTASSQDSRVQYMFVVAPISVRGHVIGQLILGTPVDPGGQLHRLLLTLLLGGVGMLVVASAGGFWLADRAMRPVKTITQAARQISETDLSRRLNLKSQDELGELAATFDRMLARLQAAFDRQRQFTADASHELRTPLTIINLEANRALSAKRTSKEYHHALSLIQSENEFMTRLVNNLLTLSRMDAGQTALKLEQIDLSDLALEVVERLTPIAAQRQVHLSIGELPQLIIEGDRQYLTQMIVNLIENGIKYTQGEDKRVRVETGCREIEGQSMAWLKVIDNGPGIPAEHMPKLFDRFYQMDSSRTRGPQTEGDEAAVQEVTAGSGLGLSIVQWIARAHGGEVAVESQPGQGAAFEVRLPAACQTA
jgi:signal transduction histidine kinase